MKFLYYAFALMAAPLLPGIINRVKALFAGRRGQPLLQLYYDCWKLLRKETVQSTELSVPGRWAPALLVATSIVALALMPLGARALLAFPGDFVVLVYVLVLGRVLLVLAALDTGSSFQGMGVSRELLIAALTESAFLLALTVLVLGTRQMTLSGIFTTTLPYGGAVAIPALVLAGVVFLLVALAESARIPFDDPNTHLELTMIHEVMVLDYSGVDLAFVLYASSLKLMLFGILIGRLLDLPTVVGVLVVVIVIGIIESLIARVRLLRIPHILGSATAIAVLALLLMLT